MKTWKMMKTLSTGMMALFGIVFVMGNTAPTCVPLDDDPEMQVVCLDDEECAGLEPDVDCEGEWACEDGACVFHCDDVTEPPDSECVMDDDCGPNQHCEIVDCWAPPCGEGEPCALCCMPIGECVDDDPGECLGDEDCPDGFYCEPMVWFDEAPLPGGDSAGCEEAPAEMPPFGMGQCVPLPQPECINDADCGPGFVCELLDDCVPLPCDDDPNMGCEELACMPFGICVPDQPDPECFDDSDCPPGFACEFMDGPGACDCPPGDEYCLMYDCMPLGQCVPTGIEGECAEDADCGPGAHCDVEEICAVSCFCDTGDCPEEMECFLYGTCVPDEPFGECMDDSDCLPGQACEFIDVPCYDDCDEDDEYCMGLCPPYGVCVEVEPFGECLDDADCKYGQVCELIDLPCYDCDPSEEYCAGDCAPYGICVDVPVPPPSECLFDEDCEDGQVCDLSEGPYPCDCDPDDEYCLMMYCMPVGVCVDDVPEPPNPCKPTGCSGQFCAAFDIESTCEWLPHYSCFQDASCGPNGPNGECAWEHTDALTDCLSMYLNAP